MANKRHLLLKNEIGTSLLFNRTRGVENSDEPTAERDYSPQKVRLNSKLTDFNADRLIRGELRDVKLEIPHFDAITIDFLKMIDANFARRLERKYGLSAMTFSNFNQTVCFAISDANRFSQNFENGIREFFNAPGNNIPEGCKDLTTINNFRFVNADRIRHHIGLKSLTENIIIKLYGEHISLINDQNSIRSKLTDYFADNNIHTLEISDTIFQIEKITQEDLAYIINNFDIIQSVQGLRYLRIVPNEYGETELGIGLKINIDANAPTIAILDTGIANDPILQPILCDDGIDLTSADAHPYTVISDHGTTVACLASFGDSFFRHDNRDMIAADARVFSIKIQEGEDGCINLKGIQDAIYQANQKYGIRLFNLSMSGGSKNYNSDISTYAYVLDKLSYELDILIFISSGNLSIEDIHEIENKRLDPNTTNEIRTFLQYPNHFYNPYISLEDAEVHVCECINLSEPAESMNNITVGALADNLSNRERSGLSLGRDYPAYYTRKFHIDYNGKINNTQFKKNQINRHIFKPDIVMPGGDVLGQNANMQVIGINCGHLDYVFGSGTSYAAPLAANLAAKILYYYPDIKAQTLKALLINSANEVNPSYLDESIENLKRKAQPLYPDIDRSEKTRLSGLFNTEYLAHTISGHGMPSIEKCLYSNDKRVTFVIEDDITFDSHKVVNLNIPSYLNLHPNKVKALVLTGTLCYSFNPIYGDSISYLPIHISFNIGNSMNHDNPTANAIEYSTSTIKDNNDRMAIKTKFSSWSDDFYPANTKRFSNVQKMRLLLNRDDISKVTNQIAIIFRCTGRDDVRYASIRQHTHKFSFVLTLEEIPSDELIHHSLYDELALCNIVDNMATLDVDADIDI